MKKFILFSTIFFSFPVFANQPFTYKTNCYLETNQEFLEDVCTVVETREKTGSLKTRNIFSNKFKISIKGKTYPEKGFMIWDSHNKFEYKWEYKYGNIPGKNNPHTYVMPGILLENVSWY